MLQQQQNAQQLAAARGLAVEAKAAKGDSMLLLLLLLLVGVGLEARLTFCRR
jgi:hypothetical protein